MSIRGALSRPRRRVARPRDTKRRLSRRILSNVDDARPERAFRDADDAEPRTRPRGDAKTPSAPRARRRARRRDAAARDIFLSTQHPPLRVAARADARCRPTSTA